MASKLKKAIGAVKDQTSISLAKVSNGGSNLEVLILKATTHEEIPIDKRHVSEILSLISSSRAYAAACASAIGKRIGRTRSWIVALKSLILVLRIFQDGDPYFPREVLHAMRRGAKILNLSNFSDDSYSSPWDYTSFVRTFALYLDERLNCFVTGKLQRRYNKPLSSRHKENLESQSGRKNHEPAIREMKPVMLLDKISYWQRLLDRAIATRPTGATKSNRLVKICIYSVVQESFDLYKDISDGLALLLDSFFHLQYQSCVKAFQVCIRASKQFEELIGFYDICKSNGVGRASEYPSVQKISEELLETLQEFLKDQSSLPSNGIPHSSSPPPKLHLPPSKDSKGGFGSRTASLEDLMNMGESETSPPMSCYSEPYGKQEDQTSNFDAFSTRSLPDEQASNLALELVLFEHEKAAQEQESGLDIFKLENKGKNQNESRRKEQEDGNWLLVLEETAIKSPFTHIQDSTAHCNGVEAVVPIQDQYNPFLEEAVKIPAIGKAPVSDFFEGEFTFKALPASTSQAEPTFSGQNLNNANELDPFAISNSLGSKGKVGDNEGTDQKTVLQEQQLWLQNQNKIIAKHLS